VRGLIKSKAAEEEPAQHESPAVIDGVEQSDQSLNIKINKRKMFSKPPIIPAKPQTTDPLAQTGEKPKAIATAVTPERTNEYSRHQPLRSSSHRPQSDSRSLSQGRPQSAKAPRAVQSHRQQSLGFARPQTATVRPTNNDENVNLLNKINLTA